MYAIHVLEKEKTRLLADKDNSGRLDELDQAIIALTLLYDPSPKSKIITREKLEEIQGKIVNILTEEVKEEGVLLRIVEKLKNL